MDGGSYRRVTAGRTLERRHGLAWLYQDRVEVTAASALPSDVRGQLDDRCGGLCQRLNALRPKLRFGHGWLSRLPFGRCHVEFPPVNRDVGRPKNDFLPCMSGPRQEIHRKL